GAATAGPGRGPGGGHENRARWPWRAALRPGRDIDAPQQQPPRGRALLRGRFGDRYRQQFSAALQVLLLAAVGQQAVMTNPLEARRQHVTQEAAQELVGRQGPRLLHIARLPIAARRDELALGTADQPAVTDGHAMRVVAQVVEQLLGSGEGRLAVDDPALTTHLGDQSGEVVRPSQGRYLGHGGREDQTAVGKEPGQALEELAAKDLAQGPHREQVAPLRRHPPRALQGQDAAGNDGMHMEVRPQLLVPGMQDHGDAERAAEVVAAELKQGLGGGLEQQVQQGPLIVLVAEDQRVELVRQGGEVVGGADRQEPGLRSGQPLRPGEGLAFGAMAIATGVVGEAFVPTVRATLPVPAQTGGAAGLEGLQDLPVRQGQSMRGPVVGTMAAHDVGQFTRGWWPRPCRGVTGGWQHRRQSLARAGSDRAGTSSGPGSRSQSKGLCSCVSFFSVTCRYSAVVLRLVCPSSSWMVRRSTPTSSRCVAKQCRRVWMPWPRWRPARSLAA